MINGLYICFILNFVMGLVFCLVLYLALSLGFFQSGLKYNFIISFLLVIWFFALF